MSINHSYSGNRPVPPSACYQGPPLCGDVLTGTLLNAFGGQPPGDDFAGLLAQLHHVKAVDPPPPFA